MADRATSHLPGLLPLQVVAEGIDIDPMEWDEGIAELGDAEPTALLPVSMGLAARLTFMTCCLSSVLRQQLPREPKLMLRQLLSATAIALFWHGGAWAVDPDTALQSHNRVREDVNAGAYPGQPVPNPPLPLLSWDRTLADQARAYAEQCVWAHSDERINVGENLAYSTALSFSIEQAVGLWADEYRGYDFVSGTCLIDACGHYTQLVWQNTLLVGCGDAICAPLRSPTGVSLAAEARYHVCRYATAGNINGERPYVITGDDPTLTAEYSEFTEELAVPYALIWQPDNTVQPTAALFEMVSVAPVRFELVDLSTEHYLDEVHVSIYDVNSARLFLPHVDTLLGGLWQRHSAVLRYVPGTAPFQLELEYFR